ncbi:MAG TPA: hypothetical protein VKA46_14200 [Gemmataceae bacterium]|nr:hypothetical protein [Gemmataceae bacterium]
MQRLFRIALLVACLTASAPVFAQSQEDRRERTEPGLILETPGRMGSCDVLQFVREGNDLYLLAAGDDKVVIVWQVVGNRLVEKRRLRWGIYREQRGSIYTMTTFRDSEKKLKVVVAGWGRVLGQVAILDFETGHLDKVLPAEAVNENSFTVWSLAASPGGEQIAWGGHDGTVWVWHPATGKATALGGPLASWEERYKAGNRVHFLTYLDERHLVSCARDGRVLEWDTSRPEQKPRRLFEFDAKKFHGVQMAVLSPDRKWIAARGDARRVEVRSFPDGHAEPIVLADFPNGHLPESVAFDPDGRHLAVGIRVRDQKANFLYELNGEVLVYDLRADRPKVTARLPMTLFADVMTFDPDGKRLAVAGGDNHDLTLWDVAREKELPALESPGHCLWKAALSADGHFLGVKDHRRSEASPRSSNDRADGEYQVFDLGLGAGRRGWTNAKGFRPVEAIERLGGWSVRVDGIMEWYAVGPDGHAHELVLSRATDDAPRCYTFLKGTDTKPIRLAVGHYWGASLFEMDPDGKFTTRDGRFERSHVYIGHQGYVTSVAPSADNKLLVTASRDMTVNCWSLADWPRQAELGVDFEVQSGKLIVKGVDAGSPAWQAGLAEGSEVVLEEKAKGPPVKGGAEAWKKRFESARPFGTFIFTYKHKGEKEVFETLMTARQRPIWRFFPTFAAAAGGKSVPQEWVLWRWQDYFYDASTNGDHYIGWQISGRRADDQPVYHPAERMRGRFLKPDKVRDMLTKGVTDPERVLFREIEPPKVTIKAAAPAVKDADVKVTVSAKQVGLGELQALARVEIWVNDRYLAKTLTGADFMAADMPPAMKGDLQPTEVTIKAGDLQFGANTIKAIAINKADGRWEDVVSVRFDSDKPHNPVLFGLVVGISDYKDSKPRQDDLSGAADAKEIYQLWQRQKGAQLYDRVEFLPPLLDAAATPEAILKELERLQDKVRSDDQFVLFLAGHGDAERVKGAREYLPGTFVFVGPKYNANRLAATTLSSKDLYAALGKLRCHQLVLLDACHSGDFASNPLQDLRRNGVGAVVIAACKNSQGSLDNLEHGLFTLALMEALGKEFKADRPPVGNGDGVLEPAELANYLIKRVPELVAEAKADKPQNPEVSPWAKELVGYRRRLAKKP